MQKWELQAACEACFLLSEAIRELLAPIQVIELSRTWENIDPVPMKAIAAVSRMAILSVVMNIYRLKETRENFLCGWLFSDKELRALGFPPVEEFIGKVNWKFFENVRNQFAGHPTQHKATQQRPGRILPAAVLGKSLRKTGLWKSENFLQRVQEKLLPGIERVRDKLINKFPKARRFVEETHPLELERAALAFGD